MAGKIRVLMSKPGIDGHWRGIVTVSRSLRDAGMEIIFGGFQSVEEIVETAIQEDVNVIGLGIHSGAHFKYTERVTDLMKEKKISDTTKQYFCQVNFRSEVRKGAIDISNIC